MATQQPQEPTNSDIMRELTNIKSKLKKAEVRDREIYYMTISAVGMTFAVAALANRIMLFAVQNAMDWANNTMVIIGIITVGIASYKWYRFKHNRKAD